MPITKPKSIANRLLAALPRKDYLRMEKHFEPVELTYGEILYEPGKPILHAYFPIDSLVSLLTLVEGRLALEVGMVGSEGMVGFPLALDILTSPVRALVQGSGRALKMDTRQFRKQLKLSAALRQELQRYIYALMAQISQTAACNRFHGVDLRLARWLLMTRDRLRSGDIHLTHEFLGHMLGVRREGVTEAAGKMQKAGLIHYNHGEIRILDDKGLEAASCDCYVPVKDMVGRAPQLARS